MALLSASSVLVNGHGPSRVGFFLQDLLDSTHCLGCKQYIPAN
jgi:hypothetical protein